MVPLNNMLTSAASALTRIADKLHVPTPRGLLSIFPSQSNSFEDLRLDPENFRIHIGKMTKENNNLYTIEMMEGLIASLIPYIKNTEDRITIVLRTHMADLLLDDISKETMLSVTEQQTLLRTLIQKKFAAHAPQIDLIDVSTIHPTVFETLEKNTSPTHLDILETEECPPLPDCPDSQAVLHYLYWCAQNCPLFFEDLQKTKTAQHQYHSEQIGPHKSDYYALVEISLRITDYLS